MAAGLSYSWGGQLEKWMTEHNKRPRGFLAADASLDDYTYPLLFQPGTDWQYGIGLDWAAFLVERITGENIKDYFQKNIFEPCGMTSTGFLPTEAIKEKLMRMTYYDAEQKPQPFENSFTGGMLPRPEDADAIGPVLSGGAGLFGTARDYLALLRGILASSNRLQTPGSTTKPLLSDASFQELFKDVLTAKGKESLTKMMTGQTFHAPELTEDGTGKDVGHSVGLCLNLIDTSIGRKAGSGSCESLVP
jgi:methyl acetate hydrolase